VFETSGNTLSFGRDVPIPFPAADVCMVGNNMFLFGLFSAHLLHRLSPGGQVVASFDSADSYQLATEESFSSHQRSQGDKARAAAISGKIGKMRKEYDFSNAKRNPYAKRLKKQITIDSMGQR
jgi:hypothetical protein